MIRRQRTRQTFTPRNNIFRPISFVSRFKPQTNMWMKTLASKKKYFCERNTNWTTVDKNSSSIGLGEMSSSEDEQIDTGSRVMVVDSRSLSAKPHDSYTSFFTDESSFINASQSLKQQNDITLVNTLRPMSIGSSEAEDSDLVPDVTSECTNVESSDGEVREEGSADDVDADVTDNIFIFEDKNVVVAVLQHPIEVVFCGRALVFPLWGAVSILGYKIDENNSEPVSVFSSYNFSYLTVRTEEPEFHVLSGKQSRFIKQKLLDIDASSICGHVMSVVDGMSVIVAFWRAPENGSVKYACHLSPKIFAAPISHFKQPDFKRFGFCLAVSSCKRWILADDHEKLATQIVDSILCSKSCGSTAPKVVVCGGKNVGKSMFLKYLMNRALSVCDKIIHLEGDPAQTEFTPVGCVALTQVEEPVLGPAFTHCRKSERMCYVGGINVENTPDLYSTSVQDLIEYHRTHLANHPLFVNTMGWNKGLGLSLLVDVLRSASPTFVVQFDCGPSQMSHNLPRLDAEFLCNACGWNSSRETMNSTETELSVLSPPAQQVKLAEGVMPAVRCRNLSIFSYMGQLQKPHLEFQPINSFTPYSIPWSAVAVYCCYQKLPPREIVHALNGSLVALCHVDESKMTDSEIQGYPKCITENPENICYGLGLVRGVDHHNKLFLVITPEKLSTLQHVNAFLMGSSKMPDEFFTTQEVEGRVPFVCESRMTSKGLTSPFKDRVYRKRIGLPRPSLLAI